jgi:ferrous-iron efflux pump FieF
MRPVTPKLKTAIAAIIVPFMLMILKIAAAILTMSISLIASALDSLMDTVSQAINFAAIKASEKPADDKHQYGHGKAEAIAGLVQAVFVGISAAFLVYKAFFRIFSGYHLQAEATGFYVMFISMVASIALSVMLKKAGRKMQSTALSASALNFSADVWTNAGVLVALGLENWWRVKNADPVISILISLYIVVSAVRIGADAISQLMDKTIPKDMLDEIDACIKAHKNMVFGYHNLRTRQVGSEKHIEFHLEVKSSLSFRDAHDLTEKIISEIKQKIPNAHVMAHPDPWE